MKIKNDINPDAFDEEEKDVDKAQASDGLFLNNDIKEYSINDEELFKETVENTDEITTFDNNIFTTSIEYKKEFESKEGEDVNYISGIIIICIILIVSYIYFSFQKFNLKKEMKNSYIEIYKSNK